MKTINFWKTLVLSAAMLTAGVGFTSCDKDDDGNLTSDPRIEVKPTTVSFDMGQEKDYKINVTSNTKWDVSTTAQGVTFSPASGKNNGSVTVKVSKDAPAKFDITFTAHGELMGMPITQSAKTAFTAGNIEGTIAAIEGDGSYDIQNAWVVQNHTAGFIMTDISGAYMFVFAGNGNGEQYSRGDVVNVKGAVETRNKYLQFSSTNQTDPAVITKTGATHSVTLPTPTVMNYQEFFAITPGEFAYVTVSGTLVQSGNYSNITFTEGSNIGSPQYLPASFNASNYYGKVVLATGFVTGMPNGINQMILTELTEDTNAETLSATPSTLSFGAAGESKDVTLSVQNPKNKTITTSISGTDASAFSAKLNGTTVTVTATKNSGSAIRNATLTITMGDLTAEVGLSQNAAGSGSVDFDFTAGYNGSANGISVDGQEYTISPITVVPSKGTGSTNPSWYSTGTALRLYGGNTFTIKGATITSVVFTFDSGETSGKNMTANTGTYNAGTWSGSTSELVFTVDSGSGHKRIKTMKVSFE